MNEQAIRFRIGIFVLAALILMAVLIMLFGGFPNYFRPASLYTIVFANAQGVAPGTPVRRSGVKIGEVRKVTLDNNTGKVEVTIQVESGFQLRKGDKATLVQGLLGSDTSIGFLAPPEEKAIDTTPVEPETVLKGYSQVDTGTLLQKTSELVPPAQDAMVEVKKVFQKIDQFMPTLEEAVKEIRDFSRATREVIPDLRKTNDEIRELVKSTRDSVPDLRRTSEEFQITARTWGKVGERVDVLLQTNEDKLVKTLDRFEETLKRLNDVFNEENQRYLRDTLKNVRNSSDRLDGIAKNTEDLIKESRVTLKSFNDSLLKVDDVLTNVQKATKPLADRGDSILKNLDESTDKLNKTMGDFREILQSVSRSDGTLQRLLSDPALFNNINDTVGSVSRLIPRVDHILRDMEIFADKIARHPESLGVGGVVRPGSGLKESSSQYRIYQTYP